MPLEVNRPIPSPIESQNPLSSGVPEDPVKLLVRARLAEKEWSLSVASKLMGRNHAYLQQYLERGVPRVLPEDARIALATILEVDEQLLREPSAKLVRRPESNLSTSFVNPAVGTTSGRSLPIVGRARGGLEGVLLMPANDPPVDWTYRPPQLEGVQDAFAFQVVGDSQAPAYNEGDIAWCNPHAPIRPGHTVLIVQTDDVAFVKTLVRRTEAVVRLSQYNPPKEFEIPKESIRSMHRVMGKWEA